MKGKIIYCCLWSCTTLFVMQAKGQVAALSGQVTSLTSGKPITGVTVSLLGSPSVSKTDDHGRFTIQASAGSTLRFTSVGFLPQDVVLKGSQLLNIKLEEKGHELEEVVVVAYGKSAKSEITGSVATLSAAYLQKRTVSNVTNVLAGMAPGISVSSGNGQPGSGASIRLRGIGSISASSEPLLVVDGAAFDGAIGDINVDDIESVSVLKDATSAALYGSRAGNGVIIVTTKKGKGALKLDVGIKQGFTQRGIKEYDRVDIYDYYPVVFQAIKNSKMFPNSGTGLSEQDASQYALDNIVKSLVYNPFNVPDNQILDSNGKMNPTAGLKYDDFDWYKAMQRTGKRKEANINLSGSAEQTSYYTSLGYLNEEGYMLNSDFQRFSARINIDSKVKSWLKAGVNIYGTGSTGKLALDAGSSSGNANAIANPFNFIRGMGAIYPVHAFDKVTAEPVIDPVTGRQYYDYGLHPGAINRPQGASPGRHVIYETILNHRDNTRVLLGGRGYMDISFLKYFTFTPSVSIDLSNRNFDYTYNNTVGDGLSYAGLSSVTNSIVKSYTFNQILTYRRSLGEHNLTILAGHENYDFLYRDRNAIKTGQIAEDIPELINYVSNYFIDGRKNVNRLESYFAKASYNLDEKYFLDGSVRKDGSSIFNPDQRWGTFFSIGGSWKLSKENFIAKHGWIDDLRFRTSYGQVGNSQLLDKAGNQIFFGFQGLYDLGFSNGAFPGTLLYSLPNPDLTWETSKSFNLGLDFSLFSNRLRGTFEYYRRGSDRLLMSVPRPLSSAVSFEYKNVGSMYNRGVEISLAADILRNETFRWTLTNNLSTFKNEITKMPKETPVITTGSKRREVGKDYYAFWLRQYAGVDASDGAALYIPAEGTAEDAMRIIDGKKYVTNSNLAMFGYSGTAIPKWTGSLQNEFEYKGLGLSFLMTYQIGGNVYDSQYAGLMNTSSFGKSYHIDAVNAWTTSNKGSNMPRIDQANSANINAASSRWLIDASYISFRNVNLFYRLPDSWTTKIGISSARITASGENLMLFSKRQGLNPTEQFDGTNSTTYLPTRIWGLGLHASF
ncbi:SusC/RagA family TonB-linked outer membrane protein [Sphingobacterium sp. 18053]|uniref:SusC/RagA family TonB-linked outer membrane protein n=1 Tax=Sphingobacterium sp. 18053 TaxID=2681401 RepID=UPI001357AB50|nr:SusC/RagA family TonB-linked outer membrane protein [Sphingobacterium sp. 18053]